MFMRTIPFIVAVTLLGYAGASVAQIKGEAAEAPAVTAKDRPVPVSAPSAQFKQYQGIKGEAAEPVSVTIPDKSSSKAPSAQSKYQGVKGEAAEPPYLR